MIKTKIFILLISCLFSITAVGQYRLSGVVTSKADSSGVDNCIVYLNEGKWSTVTNVSGEFEFLNLPEGTYTLHTSNLNYKPASRSVTMNNKDKYIVIVLEPVDNMLNVVVIEQKKAQNTYMRSVENMGIYEGKKSEVIHTDKLVANMATNNARQVYSRVAGLNIWENDGAGLQLSIGGRGLDPNRTSNFNVRQNGYDISADALGYPESYYTPPIEAIEKIQIVRGAASLQYGTQFGGLLNFILKKPVTDRKIQLLARQSIGSFGFYNSFTSISGTVNKFSYYTFFQHKRGNGWRPNSQFQNNNFYTNINYQFTKKTTAGLDLTLMDYLAQQPGGLSDAMFRADPRQSNRERNWFKVKWNLLALHFNHKFNPSNEVNLRLFGLSAHRYTVGFRPYRVATIDDNSERDLIKGEFTNWGAEGRYLKRYFIANKYLVFLGGVRYYHGFNHSTQGLGSKEKHADFNYNNTDLLTYDYSFPNRNVSLFTENIIHLSDKFSITPGLRYEYIYTTAKGYYGSISRDLAGNIIHIQKTEEYRTSGRQFVLGGVGLSYKTSKSINIYANISQNYRSITFSDMRISNPSSLIDPDMKDEKGYSMDLGVRSEKSALTYDVSVFYLNYNNRIGEVQGYDAYDRVIRLRSNIGQAVMMGVESYFESDVLQLIQPEMKNWKGVMFANAAFITSEYKVSKLAGVAGNQVEFVPKLNLKTGARLEYKNLKASFQYTHLSDQFSDATNAEDGGVSGVVGIIPAYSVMDLSLSYEYKRYKIEGSINNLTNQMYFTRRATGYPGPGIIPSDGRSFYLTLQVKI
ncbi:MAG TPA: TonB-dependent receptor [Cytophagaceae bacterium]